MLGGQGAQEVEDVARGLGVEAGGGLVEEEDLGLVQQGAGEGHALALAGGEALHPVVGPVGDAEAGEQVVGLVVRRARRQAAHARHERHVLEGGEAVVEAGLLGHHTGALTDGVAVGGRVEAEDGGAAPVGHQQAVEQADGRGLARPVGAEEGDDLAGVDLEAQPIERLLGAKGDGEVVGADGGDHDLQCGGDGGATPPSAVSGAGWPPSPGRTTAR